MRNFALLVLVVVFGWSSGASANPVEWSTASGGNGHWYEYFSTHMTWDAARSFAETQTHLGLQGHLITITSNEEREFVKSAASAFPYPGSDATPDVWLGAYQDVTAPDYSEPSGGWRWVTGEAWGFESWSSNEPNNATVLSVDGEGVGELVLLSGEWNDQYGDCPSCSGVKILVEYSPIPEPSTALLLGVGLAGLGMRRRLPWRGL